jgi:hypothetical protein
MASTEIRNDTLPDRQRFGLDAQRWAEFRLLQEPSVLERGIE